MIPSPAFKGTKQFYEDSKLDIDYGTYLLIVKTFFLILRKRLIHDGKVFKLPYGLGALGALKFKPSIRTIITKNYSLFNKEGISVPLSNLHSHGYIVKLTWQKKFPYSSNTIVNYGSIYKFKAARSLNREMAQIIKQKSIYHYYDKF